MNNCWKKDTILSIFGGASGGGPHQGKVPTIMFGDWKIRSTTIHTQMPFARFLLLAAALGTLLVTTGVQAQVACPLTQTPFASYAAKFVCGPLGTDADVVKGRYATTINVHNPQVGLDVQFCKKAVIALPERSANFGPISQVVLDTLPPDRAMGVDCTDIIGLFPVGFLPFHIEGFVVIEVPSQPPSAAVNIP